MKDKRRMSKEERLRCAMREGRIKCGRATVHKNYMMGGIKIVEWLFRREGGLAEFVSTSSYDLIAVRCCYASMKIERPEPFCRISLS